MPNITKCIELAKEFDKEGRGNDILPYLFRGFSPMTAKNPDRNEVIVIPDASHIFYNKHNEYAETILNILGKRLVTI